MEFILLKKLAKSLSSVAFPSPFKSERPKNKQVRFLDGQMDKQMENHESALGQTHGQTKKQTDQPTDGQSGV